MLLLKDVYKDFIGSLGYDFDTFPITVNGKWGSTVLNFSQEIKNIKFIDTEIQDIIQPLSDIERATETASVENETLVNLRKLTKSDSISELTQIETG